MTVREIVYNGKAVASADADNIAAFAYIPSNLHARTWLLGVDADYSAAVAAIKTVTIKTGPATADGVLSVPGLVIGTTDTKIGTIAFTFVRDRVAYHLAALAAGHTLPAGTIPQDKWGLYLFSIDSAGTVTITPAAANFTTGYNDEAAAITAKPSTPSGDTRMGHVALLTKIGSAFIGGTDSPEGGASGNVAATTNYYDDTIIALTTVGAPTRWDFANGPLLRPVPAILSTELNQAIVVELAASGTGGITGTCVAWVAAP